MPQRSFKNARRHSFCTMKNPTTKNNPHSFLEVTLTNIAFFCFPLFFLLTADTFRDEALAASVSDS